jgi:DNA-binding LacI/PurR family transcriptional regulator
LAARKARVTAHDVAREAQVSQATVSYVLNDAPNQKISAETRRRVLEAVERLGYAPSAAARSLRRGRSDLVLFILPDIPIGPTVAEVQESLTEKLQERGLVLVTRHERHARLSALARELMPAAVISAFDLNPEEEADIRAAGIGVVRALLSTDPDQEDALAIPQTRIGRLQAEHLAATGHRRIGYAAPDDPRVRMFYEPRLEGVRAVCAELGLEPPVIRDVPFDTAAAAEAAVAWHSAVPRVTGVCAYNDETAFALLAGMRRHGLSAPRDLAVIGVDNIPLAPFAVPPLTTIDNNPESFAAHLVELVMSGITGKPPKRPVHTEDVTLVVRESA